MVDVGSRSCYTDGGMLYLGALHSITFIKSTRGRRLLVPRRRRRKGVKTRERFSYELFYFSFLEDCLWSIGKIILWLEKNSVLLPLVRHLVKIKCLTRCSSFASWWREREREKIFLFFIKHTYTFWIFQLRCFYQVFCYYKTTMIMFLFATSQKEVRGEGGRRTVKSFLFKLLSGKYNTYEINP